MKEIYLRVWVDGDDTVAAALLLRLNEEFFASLTYLGSALIGHEQDVPTEDRCQLLIGLRGEEGNVDEAVASVQGQDEVDHTETLEVDHLIVSRTFGLEEIPLLDE